MKKINQCLIVLFSALSAMSVASNAEEQISVKLKSPDLTSSDLTSPALKPLNSTPLTAQFETISCAHPCKKPTLNTWWMWRTATQVELKKENAQNSEFWTWENGSVNYRFLMHAEKKVIEYSPVDLKMLNIAADSSKWQKVSNLVLQKDLASMKKTALKKTYNGLALNRYDGKIEGVNADIIWIEQLQIPLQMTYSYPKHKTTINLLDANATSATKSATSEQMLNSYERIDFADIGDMEHSASAKKWLSKAQDAPGFHSHH